MTLHILFEISLVALFIILILNKGNPIFSYKKSTTVNKDPQGDLLPHETLSAQIKPEEAGRIQVLLIEMNSALQCMNTSYTAPDKEYWFNKYNIKQIEFHMAMESLARAYFTEVFEDEVKMLNPYNISVNVLSCVVFFNPNEKPLSFR